MSFRWNGWKRAIATLIYAAAAIYEFRIGLPTRSPRNDALLIAADLAVMLFLLFYSNPRRVHTPK